MPGGGPGLTGLQVVGGGGGCVGPPNVDGGPGLLEYLGGRGMLGQGLVGIFCVSMTTWK